MKVCAIMATHGRHKCAERSLGLFIRQDYAYRATNGASKHLLIYQNSDVPQYFDGNVTEMDIVSFITRESRVASIVNDPGPFTSLGDIYTQALKHVPEDTDLITFWDDDDIFLPNHISEGVAGYLRAKERGKIAYKPAQSYYRDPRGISLMSNTLEPSIFVEYEHVKKYGFSDKTTEQHLQWVEPLVSNDLIFVDPSGPPTLIYNWGDNFPTYKTSGDYHNPKNFENCRANSKDHGDGILTPDMDLSYYYNLVKNEAS